MSSCFSTIFSVSSIIVIPYFFSKISFLSPTASLLAGDTDPSNITLTASKVSGPSHGTLTAFNSDGTFTYVPTPGFFGTDSFVYNVSNGNIALDQQATATITIDQAPPIAGAESYTVNGGQTLNIGAPGILAGDSDPTSGQLLSIIATSSTQHTANGQYDLNANGSFDYTPNAGFIGTDTFNYTVSDTNGLQSIGTVSINVTNPNPILNNDSFNATENTALNVDAAHGVLSVDSNTSGVTLSVTTSPTRGSVTLNNDGSFVYTPTNGDFGNDTFVYSASKGSFVGSATVTIDVAQAPPVAAPDIYTHITENGTLNVNAANGVLSNDSDPSNLALSATINTGPAHGSVVLNLDGSFVYTPNTAFFGQDTFTYTLSDGNHSLDTIGSVTLSVDQGAPVAVPDTYNHIAENGTLNVSAANGVLSNDSDPSNLALSATLQTGTSHGSLVLNADGSFTYTPNAAFFGQDSFTYTLSDGNHSLDRTATVTLNVDQGAPVAAPDSYIVVKNMPLLITPAGVLSNDSDPSSLPISVVSYTQPTHGAVYLISDGAFAYAPNSNYLGHDSFTYTISDGTLTSTSTVSLNVIATAPLQAKNDSYSVNESTVLTSTAGVLINDISPTGHALSVIGHTDPLHGTLSINANGSFVYTPNAGYFGPDAFAYTAYDGTLTGTAIATIDVDGVNDLSSAPGALTVNEGTANNAGSVASLVHDVEMAPITFALNVQASHGTVHMNADGTFTYTPNAGFAGKDSFKYSANADSPDHTINIVNITVNPEMVGQGVAITGFEGISSGVVTLAHFTDTNSSVGASSFTASINWGDGITSNGTVVANVSGGFDVQGQHTYGAENTYTITVAVANIDHSTASIKTNAVIAVSAPSNILLSKNSVVVGSAANTVVGTLTGVDPGQADGSTFVLNNNANGAFKISGSQLEVANTSKLVGGATDTIVITDTNSDGLSLTKTFTISIADLAPVAVNDFYNDSHNLNAPATLSVTDPTKGLLSNDKNNSNNGMALTAALVNGPAHGQLILNANGTFTYTAVNGFSGVDTFTYQANDGLLSSNIGTVSITVNTNSTLATTVSSPDSYHATSKPISILSNLTVSDVDNTNFNGGIMTVSISNNAASGDVLSIITSSTITTDTSKDILYNGVIVGKYSGGTSTSPLMITFNANSTANIVGLVSQSIGYSNSSSSPSMLDRSIQFSLTDGQGGTSNVLTEIVKVLPKI